MRINLFQFAATQRPRTLGTAVRGTLGESRLLSTGLITSGLAHGFAAVLLSSMWGSVLVRVVPPRHGRNSVDLIAAQAAFEQSAELSSQSPSILTKDTAASTQRGSDPLRPRPRTLPVTRRAATSANLDGALPTPPGGELTQPSTLPVSIRARTDSEQDSSPRDGVTVPEPEPSETVPNSRRSAIASPPSVPSVRQQGQQAPTPPQRVYSPLPEWPAEARQAQLGGRVVVRTTVGTDGRVRAASIYRSSGVESLDRSAVRAVRNWRFEPGRRFGLAIEMEVGVPINFHVEQEITR